MREKDLLNEQAYKQARADEFVWQQAKANGISRKRFLQLMVGAGAAISGLPRLLHTKPAMANEVVVKPTPPDLFYDYGSNKEMRWEAMYNRGYLVPNELFFVRNNSSTPHIDQNTWRLQIEGSGVSHPREFTYNELLSLPSVSVIRAIECAGNGRSFFDTVQGRRAAGTQWKLGAIGVAEWTGVPLREVLERSGLKPTAQDVMPEGLDPSKGRRPMPIAKALDDDTLLVYAMNGQILPPDHGFPVRVLVPGWLGAASIKWVGRIEVSEEPLYSLWNTEDYVLIGSDYPPEPPALGTIITTQVVKSAFELAWDAELSAGQYLLRGRSWSAFGKIASVEVSLDGGETWQQARLRKPNLQQAWVRWDIDWEAHPGNYNLRARATDDRGNTQPLDVPFNEKGYLYGAVVSHPVSVR
ncbi:sulfite oxidase [Iningainema tapete]|uniref:Sulfite oxidase n=1 Tax=Iningainema tapete BLCC-T55 TaxID=2748662 RepID=A0A8J6XKN2_9CYAN|nr:sulfite oxidase [Iningainema tapete]MBD2774386.1 sulfite oxidase [Iningainema tapete BLCC-T55]